MEHLTFNFDYDDQPCNIDVAQISGTGGTYHIIINKGYHGCMVQRDGQWVYLAGRNPILTLEDVQFLSLLMNERWPEDSAGMCAGYIC